MTHKINIYFQNNFLLLSQLLLFTIIVLPVCFLNNEWLNIVLGEHIDSGSILSSIIQLTNTQELHTFYNQNIPFHTLYGFPYNSLLFLIFFLLQHIGKLNTINNFFIFATIARLVNFVIAILIIKEICWFGNKFLKLFLSKVILITLLIFFSPFIHYSYHIKPDLLGLLFTIISVKHLYLYISKPKKISNIIIANVFGGLSILCKQPYIFIIVPLFFGLINSYRKNLQKNVKLILSIYIKTFIIFLSIFFIIHPYAFLDLHGFITKQKALLVMTSSTTLDNISYWIPAYLHDPIFLIFTLSPLLYFVFSVINKGQKNIFLLLLSIYISIYLLWLTLKVGPMRFDAYLLPVYPFSILIFLYIFESYFHQLFKTKNNFPKSILYILISLCFLLLITKSILNTIPKCISYLNLAYNFKLTPTYLSVNQLQTQNLILNKKEKSIIFSASLPILETSFQKASNTWQFPNESSMEAYKPNLLFIDFTVYWEKPYEYWHKFAQKNELNKELLFLDNTKKEKNIILFYKL